jgi:hypothetical protein
VPANAASDTCTGLSTTLRHRRLAITCVRARKSTTRTSLSLNTSTVHGVTGVATPR